MRLDWLRARLLVAIPVTLGCGAKTPKLEEPDEEEAQPIETRAPVADAAPVSPIVTERPIVTEAEPDDGPSPSERCAHYRDTVFETICGDTHVRGERCEPQPERLSFSSTETMYVTDPYGDLSVFRLDRDRTDRFRMANDGGGCCYSHCTTMVVATSGATEHRDPRYKPALHAIPAPPAGTSAPASSASPCPAWVKIGSTMRQLAYHASSSNTCHYRVFVRDSSVLGRPLRVRGAPHVAEVAGHDAWRGDTAAIDLALDPDVRARLASYWLDAARMEHASIAAFSALSLALLAHGAPPALVAATHRAALDEIEHARIAFAIASRYAGHEVGPSAFPAAAQTQAADLATLARETFVDGCIGEACAAAEAAHAATLARDPAIAATLRRIADDEARHAELAWSIVAWCVARDPSLRAQLRASAQPVSTHDDGLDEHGVLGSPARIQIGAAVRAITDELLAALR